MKLWKGLSLRFSLSRVTILIFTALIYCSNVCDALECNSCMIYPVPNTNCKRTECSKGACVTMQVEVDGKKKKARGCLPFGKCLVKELDMDVVSSCTKFTGKTLNAAKKKCGVSEPEDPQRNYLDPLFFGEAPPPQPPSDKSETQGTTSTEGNNLMKRADPASNLSSGEAPENALYEYCTCNQDKCNGPHAVIEDGGERRISRGSGGIIMMMAINSFIYSAALKQVYL